MDTALLNKKFERIGARLKVGVRSRQGRASSGLITLDIGFDRRGEFFQIIPARGSVPDVLVLDARPADRHLLLMVRENGAKNKYL